MKKIYIDAGHGGKDPGAVSCGINEKDIALSVAKIIKSILDGYDVEVVLTREIDEFLELEYRAELANKSNSDIFVSIHCNSYKNINSQGIETYCYKFKYDELAQKIHKELVKDTTLYSFDRGVKEGDFCVLRETSMPACLVELGFISNKQDRERLLAKQYEYAKAISDGILDYLDIKRDSVDIPPIQENKKPLYHVVIGEIASELEADKIYNLLKEQGFENIMRCVSFTKE